MKRQAVPYEDSRGIDWKQLVLATVKVAGVLAVVAVAPNAAQLLKYLKRKNLTYDAWYAQTTLSKLEKEGKVRFIMQDGMRCVQLTSLGSEWLERYMLREKMRERLKKWDGKWWLVIFDVKESARRVRDQLRSELFAHGFVRLQQSVWVTPHDCREFVTLLKTDLELGKRVLCLRVDALENDFWLRKQFGLLDKSQLICTHGRKCISIIKEAF